MCPSSGRLDSSLPPAARYVFGSFAEQLEIVISQRKNMMLPSILQVLQQALAAGTPTVV
ncbi:uncharacterized protein BT62DRAFT_937812, partial [Guyanagaster necrorhizus]